MTTGAIVAFPADAARTIGRGIRWRRYGSELYRILYRRSRNLVVLLHMFRKDTGQIPDREIRIADERWEDFKVRMDTEKRRPPRAAGHDAPLL